ncbi:ankyrin [Piromyces finnis]|uniref:Ankyrin n=1 Tax=Piromyces finnis TaxID=1754191 RepID=A0A1Y1VDW4_9FUNG|nr:ankyrin [Piromyces finnis]|eukprot:ORX53796.1 ankyrin [Piromyces finnis]
MGNVNAKDDNDDTPLIVACKKNDLKKVRELIEHKADVNKRNKKNGYTPLIIACNEGNEIITRYLVEHGADINAKDENGYTPLVFACSNGNIAVIKYLVDKGADINITDENGNTPLILSIIFKNKTIVKYLVDSGVDVNLENPVKGYTPLIVACSNDNEGKENDLNLFIVKYLMDHGAQVNRKNKKNGDTPLIMACKMGNEPVAKYLIEKGASVNIENEINRITPLIVACFSGNEELVKLLVDRGAIVNAQAESGDTPLIIACRKKNETLVKYLVRHKADINMKNKKTGDTPLTISCINEDDKIVKCLINLKADINAKNLMEDTPLIIAVTNENETIVKILVEKHANINVKNKNGHPPLVIACRKKNESLVRYLIDHGAAIEKNKYDLSLNIAIHSGNVKIVKYMVEHGANVNVEDEHGNTPLIDSCNIRNESIVKLLLDHKANVNMKCQNNNTPLSVACDNGSYTIVKYLIDHGADVNLKGKNDESPLIIACHKEETLLLAKASRQSKTSINSSFKEINKLKGEKENYLPVPTSDGSNKLETTDDNKIINAMDRKEVEECELIIKYLIDHGADVNVKSKKEGDTPLILSCKMGNETIVRYLIDHDADIDIRNENNEIPLTIAYAKENKPIIKCLINKYIKLLNNEKIQQNRYIIEENIEKFLVRYPSQANMSLDGNIDILEEMIQQKNIRLINELIKNGRDINNYMRSGKLPIEKAIENNDIDLVKELIELGANIEIRTQSGIKVVDLMKRSMNEFYKMEYIFNRNSSIEDIINTKNEEAAKYIIDQEGLNIDSEDSHGVNLLQKALLEYDIDKINELVRLGADPKKADGVIQIKLKKQLEKGKIEMKAFNSSHPDGKEEIINTLELKNYHCIASEYIISNQFEKANKLICKYDNVLKWQNENELNLLSQMIITVSNEKEKKVLEGIINNYTYTLNTKEVAVNKLNNTTPLHYLIEKINKSPDAIDLLDLILPKIDNSKILDVENSDGMTALDCAIAINNIDAVKKLYSREIELKSDSFERKENIIHLQYSLLNDTITSEKLKDMIIEIVKIRNEKEKDITFENIINDNKIKNGQSLLHIASYLGKKDIVNYLLEQKDIKLDVKDTKGRTPIFYAIIAQHEDIVKAIINKDKDKNILMETDDCNAAPLNYAIVTQNEEITSMLVPKTKDLSIHDKNGRSFLHYAVANQNIKIIESIFREISNYGEKILNIQDIEGKTAFHYAAISRNVDILNIFLQSDKIDYEIIDKNELKVIDYLLMGHLEMTEVLDEGNYNTIPGIIRKMVIKIKDKSKEMCKRNILHSACENKVSPDEAIKIVIGEKKVKISELSEVPLSSNIGKKPLDIALENPKISTDTIVELILATNILENKTEKGELLQKLLIYNRGDIARVLHIENEYINKIKDLPVLLYNLITKLNDVNKIKSTLGIPYSLDCRDFKMYEYAIVKDRYDWYREFIRHEKAVSIEKIKERIIEFNAIQILGELIDVEDFNKKNLWKKASIEIRGMLLRHYINHNMLELEIIKAANDLNINMVSKALQFSGIYLPGLLHIAVNKGSRDLAKVVIEKYGNKVFKERDDYNQTPIDIVVQTENIEMIIYFIMKGAEINEFTEDLTPIKMLINEEIGKAKEMIELINLSIDSFKKKVKDTDSCNVDKKDYLGNTLIYYAIENNNAEMVTTLIKKGANINVKNNYKETPLFIAIKYADNVIGKELINNGGNIFETFNGKSLLHYAMKRKFRDEYGDEVREAEVKNSLAIKLLEKGVIDLSRSTINGIVRYDRTFNYENITQLMYFIMADDKEKAEQLIKSEWIDLNAIDDEGITAYGYALHKHFSDLMAMMESKEPNILKHEKIIKDFFGLTDKKTVTIAAAGLVAAGLGIIAKQTNVGGMAYDLIENVVIENSKGFLNQDSRETLEQIQEDRNIIQDKAQKIIESKAVKDAYTYFKNKNKDS